MLRVGVVGVGNMGYNHARVYYELSKQGLVKLVGVADTDYSRALEVAKIFNTKAYSDYRELLSEVDAVSIAVPTKLHKDVSLDFIKAGVHVLIEKPIADVPESALEIIKAAEASNVIVTVEHIERFNPSVIRLKEVINKGLIGDIITLTARRVGPFSPGTSDVSVLIDLAVHDIDIMCFLTNSRVTKVYARGKKIRKDSLAEDYGLILLALDNDIDGLVETNRLTPYKVRELVIVGTDGIAQLNYIEQRLVLYNHEWIREARINKEEPLKLELLDFISSIKDNRNPNSPAHVGFYALKVATTALSSIRTGQILDVEYEH